MTARGDRVEIRRAGLRDVETFTRIAFSAKGYWGYPERWMRAWREVLTVTPDLIREHETYAAVVADEAVGFYVLAGKGDTLRLEHLWVAPARIGAGVGRVLFEHAMDRAAALGAGSVEIEADPNAEGFYRRMGARRIGQANSEIEGQNRTLPLLAVEVRKPRPE